MQLPTSLTALAYLAAAVASLPVDQAQAPLVSFPETRTASPESVPHAESKALETASSGQGWFLNVERWLQRKDDVEGSVAKPASAPAFCFCSGGSVCCNAPQGVQCDYGICGI